MKGFFSLGLIGLAFIGLASAGYRTVGEPIQISNGLRVNLVRLNSAPQWEGEAETLTLDAEFQSNYRLRVKVYNVTERYEVPLEIFPATGGSQNPLYDIQFQNSPEFSFKVTRRATGTVLFDTSPGDFVFANQYLTMTWRPGSENVYGIGENEQHSFRHDFSKNATYGLWARDQPPENEKNMYGVHPYVTVLENDGNTHSIALVNSNAQQFSVLQGPLIRFETIGGLIDLYFFLGPTPENTVQQYTEAVGRPPLPPYWGLGFQLSRFGYDNLENMKNVRARMNHYGIPQDVQVGDIDIMERSLDFTYAKDRFAGLPEYIKDLKQKGIKFVTILDPCISSGEDETVYKPLALGNEMNVWVEKRDGSPVLGHVWPEHDCYFADYSKPAAREWWKLLIREFHDLLEYDGLWIDMNEPSNFFDGDVTDGGCEQNSLNNPRFVPAIVGESLSKSTICPDHVQHAGRHYDVHSMYGYFQSEATLLGAREGTGKRSMVLSRSTFLGSGRWVAHWLGDNWSRWPNLHYSIIGMLQFNQFGIPFCGADICGFLENSNKEMCQRWQLLGAFYPFSRNHNVNGAIDQDPAAWGPEVAESSKNALLMRYTLLPYLYTLFYKAATEGGTVARALWHEFPTDSNTWGIDTQFMWGSGLLISPVLKEGAVAVDVYFPNARFYDYSDGSEVSTRGQTVNIPTPMDKINLHVRGGIILPLQEPAVNTELARKNNLGLAVALDDEGNSHGELFYDDGDGIDTIGKGEYFLAEFDVTNVTQTLNSKVLRNGYGLMGQRRLDSVVILGASRVTRVTVNGNVHYNFENDPSGQVNILGLNLNPVIPFTISWE